MSKPLIIALSAVLGMTLLAGCKKDDTAAADSGSGKMSSTAPTSAASGAELTIPEFEAKLKDINARSEEINKGVTPIMTAAAGHMDKPEELKKDGDALAASLSKIKDINVEYEAINAPADLKNFKDAVVSASKTAVDALDKLAEAMQKGDKEGTVAAQKALVEVVQPAATKVTDALKASGYDMDAYVKDQKFVKKS